MSEEEDIDIVALDADYDRWVHTGRLVEISRCSPDSHVAKTKLHHEEVYQIRRYLRGTAVLISNTGYQALRLLKSAYEQLSFRINIHLNKSTEEIKDILEEQTKESGYADALVVVIYGAPDDFNVEILPNSFTSDRAPSLKGKPKMFYVIGNDSIVQQVENVHESDNNDDCFLGATGFFGILFYIYVLHRYGHTLDAERMWKLQQDFSDRHQFPSRTYSSLTKKFYFFPGLTVGDVPDEIMKMDPDLIELYMKMLEQYVRIYRVRLMFVGLFGAGKTSLARRFMKKSIDGVESTDGIDVHIGKFEVPLDGDEEEWIILEENDKTLPYQQLSRLLKSDPSAEEKLPDPRDLAKDGHSAMSNGPANLTSGDQYGQWGTKGIEVERSTSEESDLSSDTSHEISSVSSSQEHEEDTDEMTNERDDQDISSECSSSAGAGTLKAPSYKTITMVMKDYQEQIKTPTRKADISLWDFAGQFVYYATHQLFFSPRAIYLLMLKMDDDLKKILEDEWYTDLTGYHQIEVHGGIMFWTKSIYTYAKGTATGVPPMVLVGTHKDKLTGNEEEKRRKAFAIFDKIVDAFTGTSIEHHIKSEHFLVDNTVVDQEVDHLKQYIMKLAKEMPTWGERIPANWLELEQALEERRTEGKFLISRKEIEDINTKAMVPIDGKENIALFLKYHHSIGTLVYFDEPRLQNSVVLEPQFIIDAFKSLISAERFEDKFGPLRNQWKAFRKRGELKHTLVSAIWSQDPRKEFSANEDKLLLFMEKLDIIAQGRVVKEDGKTTNELPFFFVPCLLKDAPHPDLLQRPEGQCYVTTPTLCFSIKEGFLPPALFNRLLAICLTRWPVAQQGQIKQLYCGCGVFDVTYGRKVDKHRLLLFSRGNKIAARITRYTANAKYADPFVCDEVRREIVEHLRTELGRYRDMYDAFTMEDQPFEYHIQCAETTEDDPLKEGLIRLEDITEACENKIYWCSSHSDRNHPHMLKPVELLMEWFQDKVPVDQVEEISLPGKTWFTSQDESVMSSPLSDGELSKVSKAFGRDWQFLALELHLSEQVVQRCEDDKPKSTLQQIYKMLQEWKKMAEKEDREATLKELVNACCRTSVSVDWDTVKNLVDTKRRRRR